MADVIRDWTDEPDGPKVPELSQEGIARLAGRLDRAIQLAQMEIDTKQREVRDLQGQVARMHDTKAKLTLLTWAAADTEQIEKLPPAT